MKYAFLTLAAIILSFSAAASISAQGPLKPDPESSLLGRQPAFTSSNNNALGISDTAIDDNNAGVQKALAGDYESAAQHFQAALKQAPNFTRAAVNLGLTYGYLKEYSQAISLLTDLAKSNPDEPDAYAVLGEMQLRTGDTDVAITNLQKALSLNPRDEYALTNLGSCYVDKKQFLEAVKYFDKAIKVNPRSVVPYNNKGTALVNLGRNKEAVGVFQEAMKLDKTKAEVYNNLGVALDAIGKKKEAFQAYLEAVRLRPKWDYAIYNLALSYIEQGNREDAAKQMNTLTALDSELAGKVKEQLYAKYVVNAAKVN